MIVWQCAWHAPRWREMSAAALLHDSPCHPLATSPLSLLRWYTAALQYTAEQSINLSRKGDAARAALRAFDQACELAAFTRDLAMGSPAALRLGKTMHHWQQQALSLRPGEVLSQGAASLQSHIASLRLGNRLSEASLSSSRAGEQLVISSRQLWDQVAGAVPVPRPLSEKVSKEALSDAWRRILLSTERFSGTWRP